MITWQDFILDDAMGPVLSIEEEEVGMKVCRGTRLGRPNVMDDVMGNIQETGQEQRPARMVGLSSSEFALTGMEASRTTPETFSRLRGGA